jgi:hypothetical protein
MHRREASPIGHSNWHGKECNVQDLESVFLTRGHVTIFDPREVIQDSLGDDHFGLTNFYYLGDLSTIMTIWKWSVAYKTMKGFLLKELLLSYDETYLPEVDVEGMTGVKEK